MVGFTCRSLRWSSAERSRIVGIDRPDRWNSAASRHWESVGCSSVHRQTSLASTGVAVHHLAGIDSRELTVVIGCQPGNPHGDVLRGSSMSLRVTFSARIDATMRELEQGGMDVTGSSGNSIV